MVLNKLDKKMPALLIVAGGGYGVIDTFRSKHGEDKHKKFVKNSIIIASTIAASLIGTRGLKIGGKKVIKGLMESMPAKELQKAQTAAVEKFLSKTDIKDEKILEAFSLTESC